MAGEKEKKGRKEDSPQSHGGHGEEKNGEERRGGVDIVSERFSQDSQRGWVQPPFTRT
jgi:hypothetical protein